MSIAQVGLPQTLDTPWCSLGRLEAGAGAVLELHNGVSTPAGRPDQQYSLLVPGGASDAQKDHLVIRGQAAGPSPAVDAIDIQPNGACAFGGSGAPQHTSVDAQGVHFATAQGVVDFVADNGNGALVIAATGSDGVRRQQMYIGSTGVSLPALSSFRLGQSGSTTGSWANDRGESSACTVTYTIIGNLLVANVFFSTGATGVYAYSGCPGLPAGLLFMAPPAVQLTPLAGTDISRVPRLFELTASAVGLETFGFFTQATITAVLAPPV
jgi:hypothetical protein